MSEALDNPDQNDSIDSETNVNEVNDSGTHPEYDSNSESYTYRCPYCKISYQNEILVRVHISRSEDMDHLNYNGFMPEIDIKVEKNGELIDTVSRRPEEIDISSLSLDMIPEDKKQEHRHILLVAAKNAEEKNYTTITEKSNKRLDEYGLNELSYSTVRRVVRKFYRPQEYQNRENNDVKTLSDLTAKQQAILIAKLILPDTSHSTIADHINCAQSYPSQVFERADNVIDDLEAKIEQEDDPRAVIKNELTDEDINELIERELLETVPIDLIGVDGEQGASKWGSPLEDHGGMSATPNNLPPSTGTGSNQQDSERLQAGNSKSNTSSQESAPDEAGSGLDDVTETKIPRREVERLQSKVRFLRDIFDYKDENALLVSLAEQVEQHCEEILQKESTSEP